MRLTPYEVYRLKSLQHHAVLGSESHTYNAHIVRESLRDRGAHIIGTKEKWPSTTRRFLCVLPDVGPWPSVPHNWEMIRFSYFAAYCEVADVQAKAFAAMKVPPPGKRCFPMPHQLVLDTIRQNRPETEELYKMRGYFTQRSLRPHTALPGEYAWLMLDEVDQNPRLQLNTTPLADPLANMIPTVVQQDSNPAPRPKKRSRNGRSAAARESAKVRRLQRQASNWEDIS
ncbi:uncharacterized protein MKK02DRAFT_31963 [Dioszegia hungarica]|uniref:Uncharacterized protein n=1 Tax=Dioszegia hungarica TaxID=4972 RepID=A0AA38HDT8_9TREE|nr:uncharacterized protein MKK02DRAFT_31963 [Dioszegia hungarica]KAI9638538.1 hypothetical protein MKK02DRAFT_31963 [Dioszegia hungarica]